MKDINENEWQKNYEAGQEYKFRNLCDKCTKHPATCEVDKEAVRKRRIKYGDCKGNDNVVECIYFKKI